MIESIVISPDIKKVQIGQTIDFSYKIFPNEIDVPVTFMSDNEKIMIVKNQTLTFLDVGVVHLLIKADKYSDYITIIVGEHQDDLSGLYEVLEKSLYKLQIELETKLKLCDADLRQSLEEYQNSIREDVIQLKSSLLQDYKILKNKYNENVKNEFHIAITTFNSNLKEKIKEFNLQADNDLNESFEKLSDLKQSGNTFIKELKQRLLNEKEEFNLSVEDIALQQKVKFIESVDLKLSELQKKVQEYVKQIDDSSEYAVNYIYKSMNTAIDNIESAENTVLKNIINLKEESIQQIKDSLNEIDEILNKYISQAKDEIDEIKISAISGIKEIEIQVKHSIEVATEGALAKLNDKLDELYKKLEDKEILLEVKLEDKKNELLDSFSSLLDHASFELEKIKSKLLNEFTQEVGHFFNLMISKEQEIIARLVSVIEGYDLELQTIIDAKVRAFKDQLDLILINSLEDFKTIINEHVDQQILRINEIRDLAISRIGTTDTSMNGKNPSVRKDAIDAIEMKKNEILSSILDSANEQVRKFIGSLVVQKYVSVLNSGETVINLSDSKFVFTERLKLYIDGILQIENKHYSVNVDNKTITLSSHFNDDVDVVVTEDFPDNEVYELKEEMIKFCNKLVSQTMLQLQNDVNIIITDSKEQIITDSKNEVDKYLKQFSEGKFHVELPGNTSIIDVPLDIMKLNSTVKVYINGILQIVDLHYDLDLDNNRVILKDNFRYNIDCVLIQQLPVSTFPRRVATLSEVDSLFENSIRISEDIDIDKIFIADDKMIDNLF